MGCADTSISILFLRGDDAPDLLEEDVVDLVPWDLVSLSSSSSSADLAGTKTGLLCSCCCLRCNERGVSTQEWVIIGHSLSTSLLLFLDVVQPRDLEGTIDAYRSFDCGLCPTTGSVLYALLSRPVRDEDQ